MRDLAAEDGSGGEIFIDAGNKMNVMLLEERPDAGEREIVTAEGGAFVAGDQSRGIEAGAAVAAHLLHGEAHEGLDAGEIHQAALQPVLVVKLHPGGQEKFYQCFDGCLQSWTTRSAFRRHVIMRCGIADVPLSGSGSRCGKWPRYFRDARITAPYTRRTPPISERAGACAPVALLGHAAALA